MSALWQFIPTERSTYPLRTSPEAQWAGAKSCTIMCKKLALRHCFCPNTWMICHPLWKMPNYWTQLWAGVLLKKNQIIAGYHTQVQTKMSKTYLQVNGDHKKPTHLTASGHKQTYFLSFCCIPRYKTHRCCFGMMHRAWLEHQQWASVGMRMAGVG